MAKPVEKRGPFSFFQLASEDEAGRQVEALLHVVCLTVDSNEQDYSTLALLDLTYYSPSRAAIPIPHQTGVLVRSTFKWL